MEKSLADPQRVKHRVTIWHCKCTQENWKHAVLCLVAQSCLTLWGPKDCSLQAPMSMRILQARILEWVAMPSSRGLLNPGLLHCRWNLYHLSHQGSYPIRVAYPFSNGSSWPRNWAVVFCTAGRFLSAELLSSVQFSCSVVSDSLRPHELQHARPPCPSPTPGVYPNLCPSSQWCHPAISSSVIPFSSYPQSLPASGSFPMSQLFTSGGQSTGVSAAASVFPMNTQHRSPLGWTGWISLQSKGLSRVFSNTMVQKHQFFSAQLSSQSNSHSHIWPLEKP